MVSPLSQVPFALTQSTKLYSGDIFREGWVLMAAHSLYCFAIMGKRTFTTLFKQLTIIFQPLTTWTAAPATGTGSVEAGLVEEPHLSPSPPCVTPAYTTHAPFPTSMMCLDTETFMQQCSSPNPCGYWWCNGVSLLCVSHASVPLVRRVERGNSWCFLPLLRQIL